MHCYFEGVPTGDNNSLYFQHAENAAKMTIKGNISKTALGRAMVLTHCTLQYYNKHKSQVLSQSDMRMTKLCSGKRTRLCLPAKPDAHTQWVIP